MSYTIKPYLPAGVALLTTMLLVLADVYFNNIAAYWTTLLWVLLFISIVIMAGQSVHATKSINNYSAQLEASKERLTNEIKHRLWAEKTTAESKIKSQFIDENIPVMLAYFNTEQRCRYHNRIYRRWFGLKPVQIEGHLLQEFADEKFSASIQNHMPDILSGKTIHEERVLKSSKGFPYIFTEQYIPHLDSKGNIIGFYTLHTPRAREKHRIAPQENQTAKSTTHANVANDDTNQTDKALNDTSSHTGTTAARITETIESGRFNLFCQKITPIDSTTLAPAQYEILIRMIDEENNLMPPGSFLPLVDQFKLMPKLDRWVANHIIEWMASHSLKNRSIISLNIARDTLCDKEFVDFIHKKLLQYNVPAHLLCFEIEEHDAGSSLGETILFLEKVRNFGCLVTLCSFGQSNVSIDLLRKLKIDYLKIDGSIVCNMLYDDKDLMRVKSINQIAHKLEIQTIAELVENDETLAKLREIGINYAQGFGIAKPFPLENFGTF